MMSLNRYLCYSTVALALVIYHAFATRQQYYPAMVYLATSKLSIATLGNFAFATALYLYKVVTRVFLGTLREAEMERVNERVNHAVMETCLAITIFRQDFSVSFISMLAALIFIKIFHWLLQDRVDYIETSPHISRLQHLRTVSFMLLLFVVDGLFLQYTVGLTLKVGVNIHLLFAFEYMIQAILVASTFLKYSLAVVDLSLERGWEHKGLYVFYLDLVTDTVHLLVYLVFFVAVFTHYGLPLHLIRDLYWTVRNLRKRFVDFLRYRRITAKINHFPDATQEDLERCDGICIICREEMLMSSNVGCKVLPCGHVFHLHCLRSWLERQQSCPICRSPVVPPSRREAVPGAVPAGQAGEAQQDQQAGEARQEDSGQPRPQPEAMQGPAADLRADPGPAAATSQGSMAEQQRALRHDSGSAAPAGAPAAAATAASSEAGPAPRTGAAVEAGSALADGVSSAAMPERAPFVTSPALAQATPLAASGGDRSAVASSSPLAAPGSQPYRSMPGPSRTVGSTQAAAVPSSPGTLPPPPPPTPPQQQQQPQPQLPLPHVPYPPFASVQIPMPVQAVPPQHPWQLLSSFQQVAPHLQPQQPPPQAHQRQQPAPQQQPAQQQQQPGAVAAPAWPHSQPAQAGLVWHVPHVFPITSMASFSPAPLQYAGQQTADAVAAIQASSTSSSTLLPVLPLGMLPTLSAPLLAPMLATTHTPLVPAAGSSAEGPSSSAAATAAIKPTAASSQPAGPRWLYGTAGHPYGMVLAPPTLFFGSRAPGSSPDGAASAPAPAPPGTPQPPSSSRFPDGALAAARSQPVPQSSPPPPPPTATGAGDAAAPASASSGFPEGVDVRPQPSPDLADAASEATRAHSSPSAAPAPEAAAAAAGPDSESAAAPLEQATAPQSGADNAGGSAVTASLPGAGASGSGTEGVGGAGEADVRQHSDEMASVDEAEGPAGDPQPEL